MDIKEQLSNILENYTHKEIKALLLEALSAKGTQKIVINACQGGFGLSCQALRWLESKGLVLEEEEELERSNPLLIECVERLGVYASSSLSKLKVVKVPLNSDYTIDVDDCGWESISF